MPRRQAEERPVPRLVWLLAGEVQLDQPGPNFDAASSLVSQLTATKAIQLADIATVQALLTLALTIDSTPTDARLWAQYRQAIAEVRLLGTASEDDDDDWTKTLGATAVRDTPKPRARKPRASGGRSGKADGQGPDAAPAARVGRRARAGT